MRSRTRRDKGKRGDGRRAPIAVNGTVPPRRVVNVKRRPREYLTVKEVELLISTARKRGRYGHRDTTMILVAFRHGLRPAEVCTLRWEMVDHRLPGDHHSGRGISCFVSEKCGKSVRPIS
jgi:integrase